MYSSRIRHLEGFKYGKNLTLKCEVIMLIDDIQFLVFKTLFSLCVSGLLGIWIKIQ